MPQAQRLRLRQALDEFVRAYAGDTGTRRRGLRAQIADDDRELVELAGGLLTRLDGGSGNTTPEGRNTPGSRARDRATTGAAGDAGGSSMDSATARVRSLMGGGATNGSAGAPAGGGNEGGTQQ